MRNKKKITNFEAYFVAQFHKIMRKRVLAIVITAVVMISATSPDKAPKMRLAEETIELGKVKYAQQVQKHIIITNCGESPLVLIDVKSECNCVSLKWNKRPIKAGQQDTIVVYFKSKQPGVFYKMVNIKSNAGTNSVPIKGEVLNKGEK